MEHRDRSCMLIGGWVSGSCAAYAIQMLSSAGDAIRAMELFCVSQLVKDPQPFVTTSIAKYKLLASHYIFIAGPEGTPAAGQQTQYHYKPWKRYGTEFAKFIEDNGLGTLATLPPILNAKHHPTTTCQVWVWQPDQVAIQKWYEKFLKDNPKPVVDAAAPYDGTDYDLDCNCEACKGKRLAFYKAHKHKPTKGDGY